MRAIDISNDGWSHWPALMRLAHCGMLAGVEVLEQAERVFHVDAHRGGQPSHVAKDAQSAQQRKVADIGAAYAAAATAANISPAMEPPMDWRPFISADPQVMHGAVCFRGTRIPVSVVLDNLAAGESAEAILTEYPTLRAEHIPAAMSYAADLARERVVPLPA